MHSYVVFAFAAILLAAHAAAWTNAPVYAKSLPAPTVTGYSSWYSNQERKPEKALNGAGLNPGNGYHSTDYGDNWMTDSTDSARWFSVKWNAAVSFDRLLFWNHNQGCGTECQNRGVSTLTVFTSTNGITWTVAKVFTNIAKAPISASSDYSVVLAFDALITTEQVKLEITANYGSAYAGFSEIRFIEADVPTPPPAGPLEGTYTFVTGVTIKRFSSYYTGQNRHPTKMINGDGLHLASDTHSILYQDNWMTSANDVQGWVVLDLGAVTAVSGLRIWNHNQEDNTYRGVKSFVLTVSNDDISYSPLGGTFYLPEAPNSDSVPYSVSLATPTASFRYVKLQIVTNWGSPEFSGISELRFLQASGPTPVPPTQPPSLRPTVTSWSSHYSTRIPDKMFDGTGFDESTGTHSTAYEVNFMSNKYDTTPWVIMDFGAHVVITGIKVWNHNQVCGYCLSRGVQTMRFLSRDCPTCEWVPIGSTISLPQAPGSSTVDYSVVRNFPPNTAFRYLKLEVLSNYGGQYTGISEMRFLQNTDPTPEPPTPVPITPQPPTPAPSVPSTPQPQLCTGACLHYICGNVGEVIQIQMVGSLAGDVWGSAIYADDSSVPAAAVHAGLLLNGQAGTVEVRCEGGQTEFTASTNNGVTSQAFGAYGASFSFPAAAPFPPPSLAPSLPDVCVNEPCLHNRCTVQGSKITMKVTGITSGSAWGSTFFTDDSPLGLAAVHAGLVAAGQIANVVATCTGEQQSFTGTTANSVTTLNFGYWQFSYQLAQGPTDPPGTPLETCTTCLNAVCTPGSDFRVFVQGSTFGSIWGTDSYSDDSHVGVAAVHAGLLNAGQAGLLIASCTGPKTSFVSSIRHGVQSNAFGAWPSSYTLRADEELTAVPCTNACMHNKCQVKGSIHTLEVTGSASGSVWGIGPYTDDSNVAVAAVHAGIVEVGATATVILTCDGAHASFDGSSANSVTTAPYTAWPFSFRLEEQ